jgi:hypothetical protein
VRQKTSLRYSAAGGEKNTKVTHFAEKIKQII